MRAVWLLLITLAGCAPTVADVSGPRTMQVQVIDFGYHTVIAAEAAVVRQRVEVLTQAGDADVMRLDVALQDHIGAPWLEFGWGDAEVFPVARTIGDVQAVAALRALLFPTASVVQIAPHADAPPETYGANDRVIVAMSVEGFDAMLRGVGASLAEPVVATLPGFTPGSLFYPSVEMYHAARTCNTWIVDRLREAGVPMRGAIVTSSATMRALRGREMVSEVAN